MYISAKNILIMIKEFLKNIITFILVYLFLYIAKIVIYAVIVSLLFFGIYAIFPDHLFLNIFLCVLTVLVLFVIRGAWRGFDI